MEDIFMENNNYNGQQQYQQQQYRQPQYQQPYQQQYQYAQPQGPIIQRNDPEYMRVASEFLKNAIISCAISTLPVGSIIAINMATKNRAALLDYIGKGGYHTDRIKLSSALSRAGRYTGIGFTIFWGIYLAYIAISLSAVIIAAIASINS